MYADLLNFLHVVREGTLTAAARKAGITQPAMTASVQRLEAELGGVLFVRDRKGAILTDAGAALLPHARAARSAVEEGRSAVAEILGLARGEVVLAAGATACTYLLPTVLAAFRRAHPTVAARLRELRTPDILESVRSGTVDLGIATRVPGDRSSWGVHEEPWGPDPLVVVEGPQEDRTAPPWLTFTPGSPLRTLLDRHFPDADVGVELGSIPAVVAHVAAGVGVALVPRIAVQDALAAGRVQERPGAPAVPDRELVLVHRGEARLSVAAAALRERLQAGSRTDSGRTENSDPGLR